MFWRAPVCIFWNWAHLLIGQWTSEVSEPGLHVEMPLSKVFKANCNTEHCRCTDNSQVCVRRRQNKRQDVAEKRRTRSANPTKKKNLTNNGRRRSVECVSVRAYLLAVGKYLEHSVPSQAQYGSLAKQHSAQAFPYTSQRCKDICDTPRDEPRYSCCCGSQRNSEELQREGSCVAQLEMFVLKEGGCELCSR